MITCDSCGREFDVDQHGPFCPQCGAKSTDDVSSDPPGDGGEDADTFDCPSCDEPLNESVSFCPSCGEDVSAYPKTEDGGDDTDDDSGVQCPDCGASLSGGEAFCPECGADIPDADDDDGDSDGQTVELVVGNETVEVEDGDVRGGEWRQKLYEAGLEKNEARRVSRTHLEFERRDDGLYVTDANSSNGTEYNGQELSPSDYRKLDDGDQLTLAGVADISVHVN